MSGSVFIPETTMLQVVSKMCDVLTNDKMPYRTPELLLRLEYDKDRTPISSNAEKNHIHRFCIKHADKPNDTELYELYRAAEVFTAAFDCGKLLCCDAEQLLPWSAPLVMKLIHSVVTVLNAEGYPAELPSELKDNQ